MTRRSILPFGPQHPVLPEPIQLRLELDDEVVVGATPVLGYVHRGLEKLAEEKDYLQTAFLIERICGICSFIHATAFCQGVEELLGVTAPPRARRLRVVWGEMHRIHSHLLWFGLLADSLGYENLFMRAWRCREAILDLMEATTGARILLGTCCVGGVRRDIGPEAQALVLRTMDEMERSLDGLIPAALADETVRHRLRGKGVLSPEEARTRGAVGPTARGSGVAMDLRQLGYAAYDELEVKPMVESDGDAYARLNVRARELYQSVDLIRRAVREMPDTPLAVPVKGNPDGETVMRVEQPRGEVLYYLRADGTKHLARVRVRTPTFANIPALLAMLPGAQLADVPMITLSIDPCVSCTER